jgi:mono/diheme cytochrome c family protein
MFDTAYGRALTIKLVIMCALFCVAGLNAFYLRPRTIEEVDEERPHEDLRKRLALSIRLEVGVALVVMLMAAVLIQYPTARQVSDAEANAAEAARTQAVIGYEESQPADDLLVTLSISPNSVGQNSFRVSLFPTTATEIAEVLRVRLRFQPPDESVGQSEIDMQVAGPFQYKAVGPFFTQAGAWDVSVDVRRAEVDDVSGSFSVNVESPGDRSEFALPLAVGSWLTVAAIVILVTALLIATWTTQWPELPEVAPRFLRVGTAAFSVIGVGLLVLSFLPGNETVEGNPIKPTAESIAMGRQLYENNCQQCHGPDGRGDGPLADTLPVAPSDYRIHVPVHGDEFLFGVITNGLGSVMPAFGDQLTEDERWHLINFLRSEFGNAETPTPAATP